MLTQLRSIRRFVASLMLGLAMVVGSAVTAAAQEVIGVYRCTLSAIIIPVSPDGELGDPIGVYDCRLVAIIITFE